MARLCGKCLKLHPTGVEDCKEAQKIMEQYAEEFNRKVEDHRQHCRGCPDPAQHVINLDELDNPSKEPIVFGAPSNPVVFVAI